MLLEPDRLHAIRVLPATPASAGAAADRERDRAQRRQDDVGGTGAWAVFVSTDARRVVVIERVPAQTSSAPAASTGSERHLPGPTYRCEGANGAAPTPLTDAGAGDIVIDLFPVAAWLAPCVSAFTVRNGKKFGSQPGCVGTSVLRGVGHGRIATFARWRSVADFLRAFENVVGRHVDSLEDINSAARKMTLGLIRPDYRAYRVHAVFEAG